MGKLLSLSTTNPMAHVLSDVSTAEGHHRAHEQVDVLTHQAPAIWRGDWGEGSRPTEDREDTFWVA